MLDDGFDCFLKIKKNARSFIANFIEYGNMLNYLAIVDLCCIRVAGWRDFTVCA